MVEKHIFPFQFLHVADAQSAEAGEQVGALHPLVIHRGGNQRPHLLNRHITAHAFRHLGLFRFLHFVERISQQPFGTDSGVQCAVEDLVIGIACRSCYRFPLGAIGCQHVVDVALTKIKVNPVQREPFSCVVLQDMGYSHDLAYAFLVPFFLILLIGFHPVQQIDLIHVIRYAGFSAGQFDDAFRLDGIGGSHRDFILPTGIAVRFRNEIHLQVFVCPLAVTVNVQIQTLTAIGQILRPETYGFLYFFRLLYSWHNCILFTRCFLMQMYE